MPNPTKPTTNLTREELEMQFIELFSGGSAYGYSWIEKVTIEEYIKMLHDGAIDHQEAAHKAMQLIDTYTQAKEREAKIEQSYRCRELIEANANSPEGAERYGDIVLLDVDDLVDELQDALETRNA